MKSNYNVAVELQRQLDDAKQRIETIERVLEHRSDAIALLAADGTLIYASVPVGKLLERPASALVGASVRSWVHEDHVEDMFAFLETLASGGVAGELTLEHRVRCRGGVVRWVEVTGTNQLADPCVGALVVTLRDITPLRAAAEAASARVAKIAQELERIVSCAQQQLDDVATEGPVRVELAAIHEAGLRASGLTRELLTFSARDAAEHRRLHWRTTTSPDAMERHLS